MTFEDPLFLDSTSSIVSPKCFFPVDIEVWHHQLRSFISTVYDKKIFYVNRFDVYILDVETRQTSILVTVPFEARCLSAAHGWVCVGGEAKGDSALIYIGESHDGKPGDFCYELLVVELGKEIVNSMTIQVLKHEEDGNHEVVVLISNNDHTVTIYSLTQRITLTTIEYPQPMNYAALSPDSTILAAVGDENKVYFLKRSLIENSELPARLAEYPEYDWRPLCVPDVPRGIPQHDDFSFAIAFSPNGKLCAVSSQGGAITVFDMSLIEEEIEPAEDAILCSFRSSRASLWGCVRAMAFSPAPWDLLAWAEDHGRVGLADVRQGFRRRQHVELDKIQIEEHDIRDATPTAWKGAEVKERITQQHEQRTQARRDRQSMGTSLLSGFQRSSPRGNDIASERWNSLPAGDRAFLQAIDAELDGEDTNRQPFSINYSSSSPRLQPSAATLRREYEIQLLNPGVRPSTLHQPRRRSSVVLSESQPSTSLTVDNSRMTMTASPGPMSEDGSVPPMSTNDLTPQAGPSSSQPLPYNIPPSDPWHVIEASLANNRHRESGVAQPAGLVQVEAAIHAERQLGERLERQLENERRLGVLLQSELEARQRLIEVGEQEVRSAESALNIQTPPSMERLLQRQLRSEHEHGLQRAEELNTEIGNMSRRVNLLMDERNSLLQRYRTHVHEVRAAQPATVASTSSANSARTSTLPTTLARIDFTELERRMQALEEERRIRRQRLQELDAQVRGAESWVNLAPTQGNTEVPPMPSPPRPRIRLTAQANSRDETNVPRSLPTPPSTSGSTTTTTTHPETTFESLLARINNRSHRLPPRIREAMGITTASTETTPASERTTIPRNSELANRVTDNDLRIARIMMARAGADMNGNWMPSAARIFLTERSARQARLLNSSSLEQVMRESGIGTAGIGWSPDGTSLFVGSEQGIFEYGLNVQDRLQHPVVELR